MDQEGIYQQQVMDRARAPVHAGLPEGATHEGTGVNPMCGDQVRVGLVLDGQGRVARIGHRTRGCAICVASADLMAELALGCDGGELKAVSAAFDRMVRDGGAAPRDELAVFAPLRRHRSRIRCATLPWSALETALADGRQCATDESKDG
ncbi:iron-sulfur cluster assembly scaffold protein [Nguyenibacter vanlangensis]|uniref:Iron-sulfur cluster assembly scaffold protein n=1 Tax=Nguyenibacter vanlangensis TaxID=1216886 RepID=A0A7Y7M5C2_9PROT|nr:iron-sulfur cluster assembly scaffold protein [Nguyenibacter vanlangensis]NVN11740.1 iron-sulfur cluster assembly scaffold protein [Nguyenibacter vanlangensis]